MSDIVMNILLWIGTALGWVTLKVFGGLLIGVSGFMGAIIIYRYLNYHRVFRSDVKDQITAFLKRCNGERGKDSGYDIRTNEHPEGTDFDWEIYPTTKAITQWVRMSKELYENNRWGFKYDEQFINNLLEEMLFEGCVGFLCDGKTHEIEGWKYNSGSLRNEKVTFLSLNRMKIVDEGNSINFIKGKRRFILKKNRIQHLGCNPKEKLIFIRDLDRWVNINCTFQWEAKLFNRKIEQCLQGTTCRIAPANGTN
ncbi:hypothetical protein LCL89_08010 [Halobacillus yeomjeoni]|uniref:hypothetical protein n=1 Tax=Halobacillus yeomjeoni TaxID=311194 RepID=UPI001CD5B50F|nr:hypothetical protein [Halobacillus yeomjeoni]MCA0984004.1 hypothetical protein [Halobacillus yeomjeoni]